VARLPHPSSRRAILVIAAALFAIATAGRFALTAPANGVGFLYLIPICLLATELGLRGGLIASGIAFALVAGWAAVSNVELGAVGYASRALTFTLVGVLVGVITEQRRHLAEENRRWFTMSNGLLAEANTDGYFTRVNPAWTDTLGYTEAELLARPFEELVHPDDLEATRAATVALGRPASQLVDFENRYRAKDGSWRWLLWTSRSDGQRIYAVAKDITDRKLVEQARLDHAEALAHTDDLTGLPNGRAWHDQLRRALARASRGGEPLSVAMLDLDGLKEINDEHGHRAGNDALKQAAAVWSAELREGDVLTRVGGDEFAAILPGSPLADAAEVAERLRATLSPQVVGTVSIGVAQWDGRESIDALAGRADDALYSAKRGGRDRVAASAPAAAPAVNPA
jgi:diguanylate cyclase (GGDEF)-like protein/PAS domain S-box-containing protein